jgi:hypothetical protein
MKWTLGVTTMTKHILMAGNGDWPLRGDVQLMWDGEVKTTESS